MAKSLQAALRVERKRADDADGRAAANARLAAAVLMEGEDAKKFLAQKEREEEVPRSTW